MGRHDVPQAFDEIAPAYDATREPLEGETLDRIAAALRKEAVASVLEVGIGTGRIAGPLTERGFVVTGIDASLGMIARARAKGLERLVRGSADRLPVADGAVDAALFVHVLHLLDDPLAALQEAVRVGRRGAFALLRPPRPDGESGAESPDEARRIVYRILRAQGHAVGDGVGGPPRRERVLLARWPPHSLEIVLDRTATRPLADSLEAIAQRAHRPLLRIPAEDVRRAVEAARAEVGDRRITYRSRLALARWTEAELTGAAADSFGP